MNRLFCALALALALFASPSFAAPADVNGPSANSIGNIRFRDLSGTGVGPFIPEHVIVDGSGNPISGGNPFPISGSFSATLSGYTPGGTSATLAVTTASAAVSLPAGTVVVVYNTGSTAATVKLGASVTATTGDVIQPASAQAFTVGANTQLAAITASGSTNLIITGGSGLPTGWGGGTAGGGGSSAITTWGGGTLGAMANYGTSPGAVLVPGVNAFVTNAITLGGTLPAFAATPTFNLGTLNGAATAANQATIITSLASIDTKTPASPATAGNQTTANTSLASIVTNTTGAATAANQTTGNTSAATTATNTGTAATGIGAPADAAYAGSGSASAIAALKGIYSVINTNSSAALPAGTNLIGKVGIDQTTPGTTNGVQVNAALPAGTNLLGKTGIDQTTPGTTNAVSLSQINAATTLAGNGTAGTGAQRVTIASDNSAIAGMGAGATGAAVPANAVLSGVSVGGNTTALVGDACQTVARTYTPINIATATTTRIVAPTSAKKTYICGMFLYPAGTTNIGIVEGTGGTCGTGTAGVIGGTTAATGIVAAAQAGFVLPNTGYAQAATAGTNVDFCLITSAAIQVSGVIVWVQL